MNRLRIVLYGLLCIVLSYAFSHASELQCKRIKRGKEFKFAWDEVTKFSNGRGIPSHYRDTAAIKYCLYIIEEKADRNAKDQSEFCPDPYTIGEVPISIIMFNSPGRYVFGVRSTIDEDKKSGLAPSKICWSDEKTCTNNNPFCVEVLN